MLAALLARTFLLPATADISLSDFIQYQLTFAAEIEILLPHTLPHRALAVPHNVNRMPHNANHGTDTVRGAGRSVGRDGRLVWRV